MYSHCCCACAQSGKAVKLSKYQGFFGAKPVVLYFYPADGTPGCTKQAQALKDSYAVWTALTANQTAVCSERRLCIAVAF